MRDILTFSKQVLLKKPIVPGLIKALQTTKPLANTTNLYLICGYLILVHLQASHLMIDIVDHLTQHVTTGEVRPVLSMSHATKMGSWSADSA